MAEYDYDLLVIGAGPGGYVGAIRASQLGIKVAIVEKDKPGGVCLNVGCIPSKALIHQAEVFHGIAALEAMGVSVDVAGLDYSAVYRKSRAAADKLSRGVQSLIKKNKIDYIGGAAVISGSNQVTIDGTRQVTARFLLVACGSRPTEIPGYEFDEQTVLSSTGVLMLQELPKTLLILGGGYIGMEFAHVMSTFGSTVTVVEMLDQILPNSDAEAVEVLVRDFSRRGITMRTATRATGLKKSASGIELSVETANGSRETLTADKILVSVGRTPNTGGLGLERAGIIPERGFIPVGDYYQTSTETIYAVGDCIASPALAHVASKEAEIAVEHMAGGNPQKRLADDLVPAAVYTEPQLAGFGPTEAQLKEKRVAYRKAVFPYRGAGKSVAIEQPEGLVKLLFDPDTRQILAAHIAGSTATELIHELLLASKAELLPEDVATMVHAHPTLSEAVMESARVAEGWPIHF
ncbi:MAG: dihydrolipoyl dehydrogenase [Spirochaetaceae bacterium]|nr:MAG: dihydrolipoyl dehydrogenase [Spirochaetaceae bacterium]